MEKLIEEIERIQDNKDPILDEKCVGLYNTTVVFLDTGKQMNLTDGYFRKKKSCFDPCFAGCYIIPGEITTIRDIHINALKSEIRNQLITEFSNDKSVIYKKKDLFQKYLPEFLRKYLLMISRD